MENNHNPVLLEESIKALDIKPDGIYADLTLGRAGHSIEIVSKLSTGKLICVDKDQTAIEAGRERLSEYSDKTIFIKSDFRYIKSVFERENIAKLNGILIDLGVSSPQLDNPERGFSYMQDSPLDMRMDTAAALSAYEVVNEWDYDRLKKIFYEYGEERYSAQIAANIIRNRPIETTLRLVDIIKGAMPAKALREKQHPAKRVFQAIRIAVNDELGALSDVLEAATDMLDERGRIAVITFHSLEDRIVKRFFTAKAKGCTCPPSFPVCVCGKKPELKIITKKPISPGEGETEENPRARSAKLRIAEKYWE